MQLKFSYDFKPKMWDESGGYAFSIVFRAEIFRKRRKQEKLEGCAPDDRSTTKKGGHKV